jgi:hypothetical protein
MTAPQLSLAARIATSLGTTMEKDTLGHGYNGTEKGGMFAAHDEKTPRSATAGDQGSPDLVDTNAEEAYWRQHFSSRSYVPEGTSFIEYRPAYRYGVDAHSRYPGKSFEQAEPELMGEWDRFKGTSSLTWEDARHAASDAWQRVSEMFLAGR